jgi:hypothetical protein
MLKRIVAGGKWKASARTHNTIVDHVERGAYDNNGRRVEEDDDVDLLDVVKVKNLTGGNLLRGSVVELGQKIIDPLTREHLWFQGLVPALSGAFGILLFPSPENAIDACQLVGPCIARVNVGNVLHRHAIVEAGSTVLRSAGAGPVRLVHPATAPGVQEMGVRLFEEPRIEIVKKTSNERDPVSGLYPGKLMRFDPLLGLAEVSEIWLEDVNQI